ncbi:hypothetical protein ACP3V3_19800 [Vibrio sp. PNB22_3_1]
MTTPQPPYQNSGTNDYRVISIQYNGVSEPDFIAVDFVRPEAQVLIWIPDEWQPTGKQSADIPSRYDDDTLADMFESDFYPNGLNG